MSNVERGLFVAAVLGLVISLSTMVPPSPSTAEQARSGRELGGGVDGSLLVTVRDRAAAPAVIAAAPGRPRRLADRVVHVRVPPSEAAGATRQLAALPGVVAVEADGFLWPARVPSDPFFDKQWAHAQTGITSAWEVETGHLGVLVAVADSGMNGLHPDLRPNLLQQVDLSTGALAGPPASGIDNDSCGVGHGTWVGGIVAATGDNGTDVTGTTWTTGLIDIALNSTRDGAFCDRIPFSALIAGIDYARSQAADVINLSLGGYLDSCPTSLQTAIDAATAAGSLVVAAAGNGELDPTTAGRFSYPASCEHVISVGATGRTVVRAGYSTTNTAVDLAAPGGDGEVGGIEGLVLTTNHTLDLGSTRYVQGTSFAAPYVSGTAALLRAAEPDATVEAISDALTTTALDLGAPGRDVEYGDGLVQPTAAVTAITNDAPEPTPTPTPTPTPPPPPPPPSGSGGGGGGGAPPPEPSPTPTPTPTPTPSQTDAEEEPAPVEPPPLEPTVSRMAAGSGATSAVPQAVVVSQTIFGDDAAQHVVLARQDEYADALAGSALAGGVGPILYAAPDAPLPTPTREELTRVLPDGGRVYLLGGPTALSSGIEAEVRSLGYNVVRLAGASREETAVAVAEEVMQRRAELGLLTSSEVVLATRANWPDAVTAGSISAMFGPPVLLTPPDQLHPATQAALTELEPDVITVVGGDAAVSAVVEVAAGSAAGAETIRLGGDSRDATAVAVADEIVRRLDRHSDTEPRYAIAVNVRAAGGYAHVLSASAIAGFNSAVFVPVEGEDGSILPPAAQTFLRDRLTNDRIMGILAGDVDVLAPGLEEEIEALLRERID